MYHPGLGIDRQLAQIRYAEVLEEAAVARDNRNAQAAHPTAAARKLVLVLAGAAPVVVWMAWMLMPH